MYSLIDLKKQKTEFAYMLILKPTQYQELPFEY